MKLSDLSSMRQQPRESVAQYVHRFWDTRNKCYNITLTDKQLADLAFQGLLGPIRERFATQEFESIGQILSKISAHEVWFESR